jgi:hypothetical protein
MLHSLKLVQGERCATDASTIEADAASHCNRVGEAGIDWGRSRPSEFSTPPAAWT